MVGTFYRSPSPGARSLRADRPERQAGETLCIIEAMKLLNEIEADASASSRPSCSIMASRSSLANRYS